jgi:Tol biopolymer transport system component
LLLGDTHENICPSWSPDGKWVYFAPSRTGGWQVWEVPAEGGTPSQVMTLGGHAPWASLDGRFIYYAKTIRESRDHLVSPLLGPATWASWSVTDEGIIFAGPSGIGGLALRPGPEGQYFGRTGYCSVLAGSVKRTPQGWS